MSEPGIYEFLTADAPADKRAVIAALIADRIYPEKIPQHHFDGARGMPCVVFQLATDARQVKYCSTDGLVNGQYQIDIYSPVRDDVPLIAGAIRRALVDYSGPMGPARVSKVLLENQFTVPADPDPGLYRRTQLYTIWYLED